MDSGKAISVAVLLERVAGGEMEASAALNEWPEDAGPDELLDSSWHDLSHFAVDDDIRRKDPRYATYQKAVLLNRAKQIREKCDRL